MHRLAYLLLLFAACDQGTCPDGSRRLGSRCVLAQHDAGDEGAAPNDADLVVQCAAESNTCPPSQPVCGTDGLCTSCTRHEDCARFTATPACLAGACVQCSPDNTSACRADQPVCDVAEGLCVQCTATDLRVCASLPDSPLCKQGGNTCVECNTDDDCKAYPDRSHCSPEHTCEPQSVRAVHS
jgi:hypothetical protein